jgi:hypothetical protein
MDNEKNISDLLKFSYEQKPVEFEQTFNSLIADKMFDAINNKKLEVAQRIYGTSEDQEETETNYETDYEPEVE